VGGKKGELTGIKGESWLGGEKCLKTIKQGSD